jgi:hypothetical protein
MTCPQVLSTRAAMMTATEKGPAKTTNKLTTTASDDDSNNDGEMD